jgi:hypothetical protein
MYVIHLKYVLSVHHLGHNMRYSAQQPARQIAKCTSMKSVSITVFSSTHKTLRNISKTYKNKYSTGVLIKLYVLYVLIHETVIGITNG